jgi:hypothetical protein
LAFNSEKQKEKLQGCTARYGRKKTKKKHRRQTAELKTRTRGQQKRTGNGGGGDSTPSYKAQDPVI